MCIQYVRCCCSHLEQAPVICHRRIGARGAFHRFKKIFRARRPIIDCDTVLDVISKDGACRACLRKKLDNAELKRAERRKDPILHKPSASPSTIVYRGVKSSREPPKSVTTPSPPNPPRSS